MAFKDIGVQHLNTISGRVLVDVRSPGEFAESTIPGSVNVPLFTDEERAAVGTVYKRESPAAARRLAMMTVSPKIPQIVEQMEQLMEQGQLVVFCWRGGMRSYAACTFMSLLKYPVYRLQGGYRAYRETVVEGLAAYPGLTSPLIVLHGMTGVGKTRALLMLKERGHQVLDLEGMARHRGSVFGTVGLGEPSNQKTFEAELWEQVRTLDAGRPVFMEAESKRIGRAVMPDWLMEDKQQGTHVLLQATMEMRVQRLMDDYLQHDNKEMEAQLAEGLEKIRKRISRMDYTVFQELLTSGQYPKLCRMLLETYYDPRYLHKLQGYQGAMMLIDADDLNHGITQLEAVATRVGDRMRERGMLV